MLELKLDRVTKQYKKKIAVDRLEYTFRKGIYGLLGENGAGKTTLMRMLVGVQKPTSGEILCGQQEIGKMGGAYRRKLGYLPQEFGYYPNFTVRRYMEYLAELKAVPPELAEGRIQRLIAQMGLEKVAKDKIKALSGGMVRRLGIAQSLLNDPEILVLDEPTAGLDPRERIRFRNMLTALGRSRMIILSSHIVSDIEDIADEVLLMKAGKIVSSGNLDSVLKTVEGKVWEIIGPEGAVESFQENYPVSSLKNMDDGKVCLRVIASQKPAGQAREAVPNLEDLYLYETFEKRS